MTHYATCIGCRADKATCATLAALKAATAGHDITSVKHKCKTRVARLLPGDPVMIETYTCAEEARRDLYYEGPSTDRWCGIFLGQDDSKGRAYIKPGTLSEQHDWPFQPKGDRVGFVNLPLRRMTRVEGAERVDLSFCGICKGQPGITGECSASNDYARVHCERVPCVKMLGGALALAGDRWIDVESVEDVPF